MCNAVDDGVDGKAVDSLVCDSVDIVFPASVDIAVGNSVAGDCLVDEICDD